MGLFTSIFNLGSTGRRHGRYQRRLERTGASERLSSVQRQIGFREKEDPREQSFQKQALFGRGLGKSTIYEQDKERLLDMQRRRMEGLRGQERVAQYYKEYIRAKHKYQRKIVYAQLLDGILSIALGAGGGGGGDATAGGPQMYGSMEGGIGTDYSGFGL